MGAIGGGLQKRHLLAFSTSLLAPGANENHDVAIYLAAVCYTIVTSRPARVRAYTSSAQRSADATRAPTISPGGNHGVLLDVVTQPGLLTLNLAPVPDLVNQDVVPSTTIYFAVQNNDSVAGIVTTTLTVRRSE